MAVVFKVGSHRVGSEKCFSLENLKIHCCSSWWVGLVGKLSWSHWVLVWGSVKQHLVNICGGDLSDGSQ